MYALLRNNGYAALLLHARVLYKPLFSYLRSLKTLILKTYGKDQSRDCRLWQHRQVCA